MIETIIGTITAYFAGPLGMVELFATIFSAICVWLAVKHNIWTWFFGAIGVILLDTYFSKLESCHPLTTDKTSLLT